MLSPILEGKRWKTMRKYYIIHIYITGQPALAQKTSYPSTPMNVYFGDTILEALAPVSANPLTAQQIQILSSRSAL